MNLADPYTAICAIPAIIEYDLTTATQELAAAWHACQQGNLSQMRSALDEVIEWQAPKQPPRTYTRLTPSAETLLRLFLRIVKKSGSTGFRRSLDNLVPESGLTRASVRRGADCLKQLGYISWNRGFGRAGFGIPNEYILDIKAIETAGLIRTRPRGPA